MRFDPRNLSSRNNEKLAWKSVVSELLWFLEEVRTREGWQKYILETKRIIVDKKTIWTANANKQGLSLISKQQNTKS